MTTPEPKRPQFALRTLLLVVALCSVLFATMSTVGMAWSLALVVLASLIIAHVAGNAIGTRLRDQAPRRNAAAGPPGLPLSTRARLPLPATGPLPLRGRQSLGIWLLVLTLSGAAGGAFCGRLALAYGEWGSLRTADWALGIASCAVLGGLAGFLAGGFFQVALWPAVAFFFRRSENVSHGKGKDALDETTALHRRHAGDTGSSAAAATRTSRRPPGAASPIP